MLSILIPVYNYDVRKLVYDLHRQVTGAAVSFEMILLDDGSQQTFIDMNRQLEAWTTWFLNCFLKTWAGS